MTTYVVLLPICHTGQRKKCEDAENMMFNSTTEMKIHFGSDAEIKDISDFMDEFNNEEIQQEKYFMTYITLI